MRRSIVFLVALAVAFAFLTTGCGDKAAEKKDEAKKEPAKTEKAAEAKKDEAKAPAEAMPAEEKPAEEKPAEVKPVEEAPAAVAPAEEKPAEEAPAEEKPAEPVAEVEVPLVVDEVIAAEVTKLSACTIEQYDTYKCEALDPAIRVLRPETQKADRSLAILNTLAAMALDANQPQVSLAALQLIGKLNNLSALQTLAKEPGLVTKSLAMNYLKILAMPSIPPRILGQVASVVTKVATMGGAMEALLAFVDQSTDKVLVSSSLKSLMVFGRMEAFPKVLELSKSSDPAMQSLALKAALEMYKWTAEENAVLCPWAEPFLADADLDRAADAAAIMIRCRLVDNSKYIDSLLAEGRKRVEAGTWLRPLIFPYRDVCFGGMMGEAEQPAPEVCQKTYEFLEWATNYEKLDPDMRGMALSFIYYQARNAETLKLMRKYENHPVEQVKKRALEAIESLERNGIK